MFVDEPLSAVLVGVASVVTALGGLAVWKSRREPPRPGTPDAHVVAVAANTAALRDMDGKFSKNLEHFSALTVAMGMVRDHLKEIEEHSRETRRDVHDLLGVQRMTRDEVIRQGVRK